VVVLFSSQLSLDSVIRAFGVHNSRKSNLELMIFIMGFKMHQLWTALEVSVTGTSISKDSQNIIILNLDPQGLQMSNDLVESSSELLEMVLECFDLQILLFALDVLLEEF